MIFRIPRGKHRARPLRLGFWWGRNVFTWQVLFKPSCRYSIAGTDQLDTNKLIGIGYLPGHHIDSARFGWRYDVSKNRIEIMAYCYVRGERIIKHIANAEIGKTYRLSLAISARAYSFFVTEEKSYESLGSCSISRPHKKKFQYRLGLYFGGNQSAPHDMNVKIDKL